MPIFITGEFVRCPYCDANMPGWAIALTGYRTSIVEHCRACDRDYVIECGIKVEHLEARKILGEE